MHTNEKRVESDRLVRNSSQARVRLCLIICLLGLALVVLFCHTLNGKLIEANLKIAKLEALAEDRELKSNEVDALWEIADSLRRIAEK